MTTTGTPTHSPVSHQARTREAGRERRQAVGRTDHGDWAPAVDRPDPIAILLEQARTRQAELVPLRHGRMAVSPFTFFRGAAAVMAADLARTPSSGLLVHSCGDAHLSNFGVFATAERHLVFDINDFDEAHHAPFEWDLKRLAASIAVASFDNGFRQREARIAVRAAVRRYREETTVYSSMSNLAVWYARIDVEAVLQFMDSQQKKRVQHGVLAQVERKTNLTAMTKLTEVVNGKLQFKNQPPLLERIEVEGSRTLEEVLELGLADYRESLLPSLRELLDLYTPRDFARKVVGVGSVGLQSWVWLFTGTNDRDPLILQIKEAQKSVLAPYNPPEVWEHQGERVVFGQRVLQAASDMFLGWATGTLEGRNVYVRQLQDMKGSAEIATMNPNEMTVYASICGWALARGHARSGMAKAVAGYLGGSDAFDQAIEEFAILYAQQNEKDHTAMLEAIRAGRLEAVDPI